MATSTVSTRFLVISDTHNFEFDDASGAFRLPLPKVDVVLHCGDLSMCGGASSYWKALKMLGAIQAEKKLVIAGNHDLDLDKPFWIANLDEGDEPEDYDRAIAVMKGPLAVQAGVTFLDEGTHVFTLKNGAKFTVYASPYQPEFNNWAFPYERNQDRFNQEEQVAEGVTSIAQNPVPNFPGVDVMMTHGPPRGVLDECDTGHIGCDNLLRAVTRAKPLMHCFGHIHEGYGASLVSWKDNENREKNPRNTFPESNTPPIKFGEETLMVNAAIMDRHHKPINAPWIVDLQLGCAL